MGRLWNDVCILGGNGDYDAGRDSEAGTNPAFFSAVRKIGGCSGEGALLPRESKKQEGAMFTRPLVQLPDCLAGLHIQHRLSACLSLCPAWIWGGI